MPKHSFGANAPSLPDAGRRAFLGTASAAGAALLITAVPAVAARPGNDPEPDPVFAAIAAYTEADRALKIADDTQAAAEAGGVANWAEICELDRLGGILFNTEQTALEALIRTTPTTAAGLAAWAGFLLDTMGRLTILDEDCVLTSEVQGMLMTVQGFATGSHQIG